MNSLLELLNQALSPKQTFCYLCQEDDIIGEDNLCDSCRQQLRHCVSTVALPYLDGFDAGLLYQDPVRYGIRSMKFRDRREFAPFFAQYMCIPDKWQVDIICPVPLHPIREFRRGYNQSELLARELSAAYQIPYCVDLLQKIKNTRPQMRLHMENRKRNVKGVYLAAKEARGLNILLVDDVCTTGSTLSACAKELKRKGASRVYGVCACRVEKI